MKKKKLFMETTKIEASQTVGEIQRLLGEYGASAIMTEYENKEVTAVSFELDLNGRRFPYRLPCRWEAIKTIFKERKGSKGRPFLDINNQSKRVAWRQILRWVQAQLAFTETNMTKIQEVFMPYLTLLLIEN